EARPHALDVLDGVLDVPADGAEGGRRRGVAAERGDQHGQHERIELRPDVRERQVGRKRLQEAGVGSVPVRVDEEPAVPVVRNEGRPCAPFTVNVSTVLKVSAAAGRTSRSSTASVRMATGALLTKATWS